MGDAAPALRMRNRLRAKTGASLLWPQCTRARYQLFSTRVRAVELINRAFVAVSGAIG